MKRGDAGPGALRALFGDPRVFPDDTAAECQEGPQRQRWACVTADSGAVLLVRYVPRFPLLVTAGRGLRVPGLLPNTSCHAVTTGLGLPKPTWSLLGCLLWDCDASARGFVRVQNRAVTFG